MSSNQVQVPNEGFFEHITKNKEKGVAKSESPTSTQVDDYRRVVAAVIGYLDTVNKNDLPRGMIRQLTQDLRSVKEQITSLQSNQSLVGSKLAIEETIQMALDKLYVAERQVSQLDKLTMKQQEEYFHLYTDAVKFLRTAYEKFAHPT